MRKKLPRKKRNIKMETRNKAKRNSSRKAFNQKNKFLHLMRMMKLIVN